MPLTGFDRFVAGANLPWIGYGTDVGASAWFPTGGLSAQPGARDRLERTLAALAADGVPIVRTFLFCDARSGVRFDDRGVPTGLDHAVFQDVDALLAAARRHGIRLLPVLLDFHLCAPARMVRGVQLGGRSRLVDDASAREALVDLVIRPLVERYGGDEAILAWDVMNEPEWCVERGPLPRRCRVSVDALQALLGQTVRCVREAGRQPVTIGCATVAGITLVRPLDLDLYQVHWYERFGWEALEQPVSELGLGDRPVLLGEFPGRGPAIVDVLGAARRAGYAGALVWSVLAGDAQSAYPSELADWLQADRP